MRIALINGSPKRKNSASEILLNDLKTFITYDYSEFVFNTSTISDDFIKELNSFDALVFFFPLYVDGIPSHLLSCLCQLEDIGIANKSIRVYGVANNGFYEGIQNDVALEILENWSNKMGLMWGMGIGFGGGESLVTMQNIPSGEGPKKPLSMAFKELATIIGTKSSAENNYIQIQMPRNTYKSSAEMLWKNLIRENDGKIKDFERKL